jgi:heme A synthase
VRALASISAGLVLVQSVVGALVRHMDAGMACPDVPLCLGQVVPPLVNAPITVHFLHRVLAVGVATVVIGLAVWARRSGVGDPARRWLDRAAFLAVVQVGLGIASILTVLAVVPVALHTLFAAALLASLVHAATIAHHAPTARSKASEPAPAVA